MLFRSLGPERGLRNFWHCNTFSFGIAQGGGAGKLMAEWILEGRPGFDVWGWDRRRYKEYATTEYTIAKAKELYQHEYAMGFPNKEWPAGRPGWTSPLYDTLKAKGAYFGQRGGWERPTWFDPTGNVPTDDYSFFRTQAWRGPVGEECDAVRNRVGILDMPGFTKIEVTGPGATAFLDHLLCTKLPRQGRITLAYALLTNDFSIAHVASVSSRNMQVAMKWASLYSGQPGSLLFWTWTMSLFMWAFTAITVPKIPWGGAHAVGTMGVILASFLLALNFFASPFTLSPVTTHCWLR